MLTNCLKGAIAGAKHLAEQGDFNGTLNLIFQPAEEGFGGAKKMMEEGLFEQFPCDPIVAGGRDLPL